MHAFDGQTVVDSKTVRMLRGRTVKSSATQPCDGHWTLDSDRVKQVCHRVTSSEVTY